MRGKRVSQAVAAFFAHTGIDPAEVEREVSEFMEAVDAEKIGNIVDRIDRITQKLDGLASLIPDFGSLDAGHVDLTKVLVQGLAGQALGLLVKQSAAISKKLEGLAQEEKEEL